MTQKHLKMSLVISFLSMLTFGNRVCADSLHPRSVFALVVGVNQTSDGETELRYADDDAIQNAVLAAQLGNERNVILLTDMDAETSEMFPGRDIESPTKANLYDAMSRLNHAMKQEIENGTSPELYLFYTGHGNVQNNLGYVTLKDDRLTRDELLAMLNSSLASRNHLIIDACKSYFMVFERGPGGERRQVSGLLKSAELPENTGVFLSTSSAANSHEWEAISAGVFSHEVRSALRGGADLDLNGRISYEEAAAFVWNANQSIPLRKFRPSFYIRPPRGETASRSIIADLTHATGHWLNAAPAQSVRQYIEDARGTRIAEFHPDIGQHISILIPKERPLYVRRPGSPREYELPNQSEVDLTRLEARNSIVLARGAEHLAFLKLFKVPFGTEALAQYRQEFSDEAIHSPPKGGELERTVDSREASPWVRRTIGLLGLASAGAGAAMTGVAFSRYKKAPTEESQQDAVDRNNSNARLNVAAVTCYAAAGAMLSTWAILAIISRQKAKRRSTQLTMGLNPGGLAVTGRF